MIQIGNLQEETVDEEVQSPKARENLKRKKVESVKVIVVMILSFHQMIVIMKQGIQEQELELQQERR